MPFVAERIRGKGIGVGMGANAYDRGKRVFEVEGVILGSRLK